MQQIIREGLDLIKKNGQLLVSMKLFKNLLESVKLSTLKREERKMFPAYDGTFFSFLIIQQTKVLMWVMILKEQCSWLLLH